MADTDITEEAEQVSEPRAMTETDITEEAGPVGDPRAMAETDITEEAEPVSEPSFHLAMKELLDKLIQDVKDLSVEAGEKKTCVNDPNLDAEDPKKAGLRKLGLELESEIEAMLATPLINLPDDPAGHLTLASEEMAVAADQSSRTLLYYKSRVEELNQKRRKYEDMVRKATSVSEALDELLQQHRTEEDKRVALERRCERMSLLFRQLRAELHFVVETFSLEEGSTPESVKSVEDLLESLVTQMLSNPNDPYVEIDDSMEEGHITLLLAANLIHRHPVDLTRIRFVDPRV